jgi:hypothetical protein
MCKGKAIPLKVWTDPEGSRRLRLQISRQSTPDCGKIVDPKHLPPFSPPPKEIFLVLISERD